jgi:sarcosine oxidase subunit gamma
MADLAPPRAIAGITSFRDHAGLLHALAAHFGAPAPETQAWVTAGSVTLSCLAPGRYLASTAPSPDFVQSLVQRFAGLAAITDQSDQWVVFTGVSRDTLARIVPIDLRPATLPPGRLALTTAGHFNLRLWCLQAGYEVAAPRSLAQDLKHALHG